MEVFNNQNCAVRDDLKKTMQPGCRISMAAACFSIYAYKELKDELESCKEFRFMFTSPTFVAESSKKDSREFYISRLHRENNLYGTEFEVKLRNELKQKAVAKECAEWLKKKAKFKSIKAQEIGNNYLVVNSDDSYTYLPLNTFTTVDLGCEQGNSLSNMVTRFENPHSKVFLQTFDQIWNDPAKLADVTDEVISKIASVYQENPPELVYFLTLYYIFSEFLEDISEDVLPNEATGFKNSIIWNKLFNFQKDAAVAIINKLEQYNGCILADSVGLGKTFTALAVIKYYEGRNKNVLVLCPKKLSENWMTYRSNVTNNPLEKDRLRYDVLYHTDLSRDSGDTRIGLPIEQINWGNYDLVVIDESHNFRNGSGTRRGSDKENRYSRLMNRVLKQGVKTKVLMLSATPVNNRFYDLRNQLALAYEGDPTAFNEQLDTKYDIDTIFRQAQTVYNAWSRLPEEKRTTENLLSKLDYDFFEVLDSVTIARSRRHIQNYYDVKDIGSFPTRLKPISLNPKLTDMKGAINYKEIFEQLNILHLTVYTPTAFILEDKLPKYVSAHETEKFMKGRESGIRRLMSINLLKRMESSVHSFALTVARIKQYLEDTNALIDRFASGFGNSTLSDVRDLSAEIDEFDEDDQNTDFFNVGKNLQIDLRDMDYVSWQKDIKEDIETLRLLLSMIEDITVKYDLKLKTLFQVIRDKVQNPINPENKKILIFTAFADTAEYLYDNVSEMALNELGLNTALVTGNVEGRTTLPRFKAEMNHILTCFSPVSKDRSLLYPRDEDKNIDILIATDCISEGQNLQDCDYCINYDIHWNPVRIVQRFGRIDRIGSQNSYIQLVNFWPDLDLDEYINLKSRVEQRMRITVATSTGDDDLINEEEKGDLEYRRTQLKRLQDEVVDLEEMNTGVSIMDLGLNDFRMDLLSYMKTHQDIKHAPLGIHAIVKGNKPGVIFVLKNVNEEVNIDKQNRLHPFYLLFVGESGDVIFNHLQPKETLDIMRSLARGKDQPDMALCDAFNRDSEDGRNMQKISSLLESAIDSVIEKEEDSAVASLFNPGKTTLLSKNFTGLDDFELICFMVVM